ncbi:bifunctional lysylphosphatidylglycerol flippase/synthetase MprF [Blastopirellula retiformator]|uniref:Phosphatidylglycerol lysyltransferase n=1 Tax=Blastopirellula retiformator TaxID=2527970 RepID=A0A5C5VK38_9BACT|nr:bifunctional lysylphosphatidylglycerol flippase/synthetase MprF [Blastopirellula retiformator]TWT38353.1 Phosphatidylglycerol lysyltransferase [Blastopirellula retiformator]
MKRLLSRLSPFLAVLIFIAAAWLLAHELRNYRWHDVRESLSAMPPQKIAFSIVLMILNYVVLVGYDLLALKAIARKLPLLRVAFASFTGFAASYNFGATLGGVPVRYRSYSVLGLSSVEVLQISIMLGGTFWIGVFAIGGLAFILDPFTLPPDLHLPITSVSGLGWLLVASAVVYMGLTFLWKKPFTIAGHEIRLPGPGIAVGQLGIAIADIMIACGCLYVLLPPDVGMSYPQFLGVFLLAQIAVVLTHVPGGVGVFELVILTLTESTAKDDVVAALLVFRVIYYLLPLFVAILLLGAQEYRAHRHHFDPVARQAWQIASSLLPTLLAFAAFIAGVVLLLSGNTPGIGERITTLKHYIPLSFLEASHFLGSVAGVALLLTARGLQLKLDSAWWGAAFLLVAGIITSLLKGLDYEAAILLSLVLIALVACRDQFYRKGSLVHERFSPGWLALLALALVSATWLGFFSYRHVDYQNDLWWEFTFHGDASRFLRASVGVAVVVLVFAIWKLLSRAPGPRTEPPTAAELETVAAIVSQSPRVSSTLALLGDKRFLFSDDNTAFIMYAVERRSWVAMGDPVGPVEQWSELVWKFRELCDRYHGWPVFYQVAPESLSIYLDQGLTLLKLGEDGRVPVRDYSIAGNHFKSLRSTRNKLQKSGYTFEIVPRDQTAELMPRLREISDGWLAEKNSAEKGFSLAFFEEEYLRHFDIAVIRDAEKIVAFANVLANEPKEEASIDLMRYDSSIPGLMDFLFIELLLWAKEQGYEWFNFGMAPLSGIEDRKLAPMWNKVAGLVYRHGDHFYSFEGLRAYKSKFKPVWTSRYLASPGGWALPQVLADVTRLIGRHRPSSDSADDEP